MKRNMRGHKYYFLSIYIVIISLISIVTFLYGYFPLSYSENSVSSREDIPTMIDDTRIRIDEMYRPVVKKVIIMVIDALRWDFVHGPLGKEHMPDTNNFLANSAGCLYKTRVHSPTVTLPRLKAMMTGGVPNFIDVIFNLGASEVTSDSLLRQAVNHGYKSIFYGDDTWLKLFPTSFSRYESTNTFYMTDYTEVDDNVTRNVVKELDREDWSIMILHYSGLDHIGHYFGPFSSVIEPKLREMDKVISIIQNYVLKQKDKGQETLFLVSSDHGMKDSGSHGGATLEETLVPLIVFGIPCANHENLETEVSQTDIAPTLSVLLGVPIPSSNLGSIILDMMEGSSFSQKLFALHYNAKQLYSQYEKLHQHQLNEVHETFQNAIKLHSAWLSARSNSHEMVHDIFVMYESAIMRMKSELTKSLLEYDIHFMSIAAIYMCQMLYLCICPEKSLSTSNNKRFFISFIVSCIFWELLNRISDPTSESLFSSKNFSSLRLAFLVPMIGILLSNCYVCSIFLVSSQQGTKLNPVQILLTAANVAHALSLSSSSFVEEEHQTWYFYWITILTLLMYDRFTQGNRGKFQRVITYLSLLMISHRILRKMNSTGNKFAHLPDISDWLLNQDSHLGMTLLLISSLIALIAIDYYCESSKHKFVVLSLDIILAVLLYLRHAVTKSVFCPRLYPLSRGITEIRYFWIITFVYVVYSLYQLKKRLQTSQGKSVSTLLYLILKIWVIISCMLHRPYNVVLLPIQLVAGTTIHKLTQIPRYYDLKVFLYLWSGSAFYFYQGNSNSLATVDIAAGYVGLESYRPFITGSFLAINTYSAQGLGLLMYLYDNSLQCSMSAQHFLPLFKQYILWRLLPVTFYLIITSFQRHHLFVWTVFAPKLLYEVMHTFVIFSIMLILQSVLEFYTWIEKRVKP